MSPYRSPCVRYHASIGIFLLNNAFVPCSWLSQGVVAATRLKVSYSPLLLIQSLTKYFKGSAGEDRKSVRHQDSRLEMWRR